MAPIHPHYYGNRPCQIHHFSTSKLVRRNRIGFSGDGDRIRVGSNGRWTNHRILSRNPVLSLDDGPATRPMVAVVEFLDDVGAVCGVSDYLVVLADSSNTIGNVAKWEPL